MAKGVIPSPAAYKRIGDVTRYIEGTKRHRTGETGWNPRPTSGRFRGFLLTDLDAATETKTDPATATVQRLVMNSAGNLVDGPEETIVNRDTTLILSAGTYVKYERVDGELEIYWAACEADVSSSS